MQQLPQQQLTLGIGAFTAEVTDTTLTGYLGAVVHQRLTQFLSIKAARDQKNPINNHFTKELYILHEQMSKLKTECDDLSLRIKTTKDGNLTIRLQNQLEEKTSKISELYSQIQEKVIESEKDVAFQEEVKKRQAEWDTIATQSFEELWNMKVEIVKYFLEKKGFKNISEVIDHSTDMQVQLLIEAIIDNPENNLQQDFFQLSGLQRAKRQ
jgi:hypothetical protein